MEKWVQVKGFEGFYSISNFGNLKREKRIVKRLNNGVLTNHTYVERMMKLPITSSGYNQIILHKNGVSKNLYIHRLVAQHFIKNPDKKPVVNHKDGDKLNNHYSNLEWMTVSENTKHAFDILGFIPNTSGIHPKARVNQLDKETGEILETFESITEAYKKTKIGHISSVCRNKRRTAGGYKWEYAD